jgi:hypothetical protein
MTPIKFTRKNGETHFHYNISELREFVKQGKAKGNVGVILTKRKGNILTYRGFGVIENPFTHIQTVSIVHWDFFDGPLPSDEEMLIPPKPFFDGSHIEFVTVDLSDTNEEVKS